MGGCLQRRCGSRPSYFSYYLSIGMKARQLVMKRPVGVLESEVQRVSLSIPRHKFLPELLYRFRNGNAV